MEWPCNNCNDNPYDDFDTRSCPYYDKCKKLKDYSNKCRKIRLEKGLTWCTDCKYYNTKEFYCSAIDSVVDSYTRNFDTKCLFFKEI